MRKGGIEMKKNDNNDIFSGMGSPRGNKKLYWIVLGIFALVEIIFGISVFFR